MMLEDIMKTDVVSVKPADRLDRAFKLMEDHKIRHLPVTDEEMTIIGIVSDRDLRDASPSVFNPSESSFAEKEVSSIMKRDVITALPTDFVEDAATVMVENQFSCLPIEREDRLVGIITDSDLLKTLVRLTGADLPTSRLEVQVPNISGMLTRAASLISEQGVNIQSVLVYPAKNPEKKTLVFRVETMDTRKLVERMEAHEFTVLWPEQTPGMSI
ncbi:acetoin utilization AcuB family protein [Alteribacter natronophilus]|uniref:acetoin utilization AcuB family protein n=1 Tax=Alteribacter natronophilus TaxID=2583810 RepID=UPI00110F54E0|nr:acetoin utilization AcuB family protein [Alteribacter natronophilus]TMW71745.1 CBS domain-containing protein [Alteribacter natronophilus]